MCVSSARERSFEDRFAWLIRGEAGKKPILKKMVFYPHGTLVHFGSKKWRAQCCRHASPHRTPDWQGAPTAHFLTDQGGFFLRPRLRPFLNWGWHRWCPRDPPQKRWFYKKNVISRAQNAYLFSRFFWLGSTGGIQKGLRVGFFAVVPGRAEKGPPPICRKFSNRCFA